MRGATPAHNHDDILIAISIHTPHAGSDRGIGKHREIAVDFNPHSPCGERRPFFFSITTSCSFQSTLPMRGATTTDYQLLYIPFNFNPHSPCGERLNEHMQMALTIANFNPHSPCGERLHGAATNLIQLSHFNPHSPCGERRHNQRLICDRYYFNPHSPCGERQTPFCGAVGCSYISIHIPHAGSDPQS